MNDRRFILGLVACFIVFVSLSALSYASTPAAASQCIDCHSKVTPNIVSDWKLSKHSQAEITCVACHGDQHQPVDDVSKARRDAHSFCWEKPLDNGRRVWLVSLLRFTTNGTGWL